MTIVTHLKSLQALELAIREGSLKDAADRLGITPAAVGQRIRALEDFLEIDLLTRSRSGLQPSPELEHALADLKSAFAALERVTDTLDFQRRTEIHVVAERDLSELWLDRRIDAFRAENPRILFNVNGTGDVPLRLGAPDVRIEFSDGPGEVLFADRYLPVTGPDNIRRIADWDPVMQMEGMPLLHLEAHRSGIGVPGWVDWFGTYGYREQGTDRGVYYRNARTAMQAVRENVGFLVIGLGLVVDEINTPCSNVVLPFPSGQYLTSTHAYRLRTRDDLLRSPQLQRFVAWLQSEAAATSQKIEDLVGKPGG